MIRSPCLTNWCSDICLLVSCLLTGLQFQSWLSVTPLDDEERLLFLFTKAQMTYRPYDDQSFWWWNGNIQNALKGQRWWKKAPPYCHSVVSLLNINSPLMTNDLPYRDGVDHLLNPNVKFKKHKLSLSPVCISINLSMSSTKDHSNNMLKVRYLLFYSKVRKLLYHCNMLKIYMACSCVNCFWSGFLRMIEQKVREWIKPISLILLISNWLRRRFLHNHFHIHFVRHTLSDWPIQKLLKTAATAAGLKNKPGQHKSVFKLFSSLPAREAPTLEADLEKMFAQSKCWIKRHLIQVKR